MIYDYRNCRTFLTIHHPLTPFVFSFLDTNPRAEHSRILDKDCITPPNINARLVLPFNAGINLGTKSYFPLPVHPVIRLWLIWPTSIYPPDKKIKMRLEAKKPAKMARCAICESLCSCFCDSDSDSDCDCDCHPQIFDFSPTINKTISRQLLCSPGQRQMQNSREHKKSLKIYMYMKYKKIEKSKHCIFNKFLVCFNNIWDLYRISKSNPHTLPHCWWLFVVVIGVVVAVAVAAGV